MKVEDLHHVAIICSNYEISKDFYVGVLGCTIISETYREDRQSYKLDLRFGKTGQIELFSFPNPPRRVSNPEACGLRHLAFKVKDIDAAVAHLKAFGISAEPIRVDKITGKQYTFFHDPDKLPLEIYEI